MTQPFRAAFLLLPNLTQLDLTGPYEVMSRIPNSEVHLVWKTRDAVRSDKGLAIMPTTTFADCPPVDLICAPGGSGVNQAMIDAEVIGFVRRMAKSARYVTSVCTGALVLGAAGLLAGKRAATHWMSRELLREFGAIPSEARVEIDGNVMTGGGVTAGIDFGLRAVAEIFGREAAEKIQLYMEYDPEPPLAAGSPRTASPEVVTAVRRMAEPTMRERLAAVKQAASALAAV